MKAVIIVGCVLALTGLTTSAKSEETVNNICQASQPTRLKDFRITVKYTAEYNARMNRYNAEVKVCDAHYHPSCVKTTNGELLCYDNYHYDNAYWQHRCGDAGTINSNGPEQIDLSKQINDEEWETNTRCNDLPGWKEWSK